MYEIGVHMSGCFYIKDRSATDNYTSEGYLVNGNVLYICSSYEECESKLSTLINEGDNILVTLPMHKFLERLNFTSSLSKMLNIPEENLSKVHVNTLSALAMLISSDNPRQDLNRITQLCWHENLKSELQLCLNLAESNLKGGEAHG